MSEHEETIRNLKDQIKLMRNCYNCRFFEYDLENNNVQCTKTIEFGCNNELWEWDYIQGVKNEL